MQTLDEDGYVVNRAEEIIRECAKCTDFGPMLEKEFAKNIIEIASYPSVRVENALLNSMDCLQKVIEVAGRHGIIIYPLSVYPGPYEPRLTRNKYYQFKAKYLHDPKIWFLESRRTAFHYHYTLPRGMFDHRKKFLKVCMAPKVKQTLLDSYNMSIAMDPALVTLFQSSPFYNGKYLVKDSGALFQRTGKHLPHSKLAIYNRHPTFGGLPIYKHTVSDLIYAINRRYKKVKEIVDRNNLKKDIPKRYKRVLDYAWHSVRINKRGTLEQRTMDMNHPKYVIAGAVLMKHIHRRIHQDFLRVMPSDIGISEPFRQEGEVVHIPPHTHLRKKLQRWSICDGFENREVLSYTRRLFRFGKRCTPPKFYDAIRPLERMIERKKSVSDVLLERAARMGYGREDTIPDPVCARIALKSCGQLYKEIEKTKRAITDL